MKDINQKQSNNNENNQMKPQNMFGRKGPGSHSMMRPAEKAKDAKGTLKRFATYLKPRKFRIMIVFILAILSTVFATLGPVFLAKATDKIIEGAKAIIAGVEGAAIDYTYIARILGMLLILYLFSSLFAFLMQYLMASVAQETVYEMRKSINDKFDRLPLKYFDSRTHGEVLSRVINDLDTISTTLQQSLTQLITAVITIIGTISMMLYLNPLLTIVALATVPFSILLTKAVAKHSKKYYRKQQKILGSLNGHIEEMITGHLVVKAFGKEKDSIDTFKDYNETLFDTGWRAQFLSGVIMPAMNIISNIGYVFLSVVGGIMVMNGQVSVGTIQAFIQYSKRFHQPIVQTANIANLIQSTIASAERVFEVLDEHEEIESLKNGVSLSVPKGEVTFEHVKFGYNDDSLLMTDLSFKASPGQTIAIVGPTGAGKTTLVNLLMRFYDIQDGLIKVDDIDTMDISREKLRRVFGMVLQDTWLFHGTIRDNIGYACDNPSEEDIIRAAKSAHADHFIRTLPEGYDTMINEEASNISQGQKQLLTIARAILANPSILILDEATSSVDTRTEVIIQKAMKNLIENRTSFVIAHRLSTIKDADLILVMKEGDIIEQGCHEELLEIKGFYAELYYSQFSTGERAS